jgi:hypothetical protein
MTEAVPDDIVHLYGDMEIPESIPVDGWTLEIPDDGKICRYERSSQERFIMPSYKLVPEAKAWCDENLRDRYWVLGSGFDMNKRTLLFFFTLEHDYILFKMRWG